MTPAQKDAMRRVAASTEPVKLPGPTASILAHRYGYIEQVGGGWTLTPQGRASLAAERAEQARSDTESGLTSEAREWARRVEAWLEAHQQFARQQYGLWRYARHVAACDYDGVDPVITGQWTPDGREYVEQTVRGAAKIMRDFDDAVKLAADRDVGVTISYEADDKVPRSRKDAAKAAVTGAGVVSLATFRERRPNPKGAA